MGWCKGVVDIFSWIRAPGDNINPLALKLLYNILHTRTFHTDTGTNRVDV